MPVKIRKDIDTDALLERCWFNMDTSQIQIPDELKNLWKNDDEAPGLKLARYLRNPKNFGFLCHWIFNIKLAPFQVAILQELWRRRFPMIIASRGASKTFLLSLYSMIKCLLIPEHKIIAVGAGFRQSKHLFEYTDAIWSRAPILRDLCKGHYIRSGPHREPDRCMMQLGTSAMKFLPIGDGCLVGNSRITCSDGIFTINRDHHSASLDKHSFDRPLNIWNGTEFVHSNTAYCNGLSKTKRITTNKGYSIEGTLNHKIKVFKNHKIIWNTLEEIQVGDYVLIDRSNRWHNQTNITPEAAYALGLMIGDGNWTNKYFLRFTTIDIELVKLLSIGLGYSFKSTGDGLHYQCQGKQFHKDFLDRFGLEITHTYDKKIPLSVLNSSKEAVANCICGVFDTDGTVFVSEAKGGCAVAVSLTNTSIELIDQIQYLLLHFGIISHKYSRHRDPKHHIVYELLITGKDVFLFQKYIGFKLFRKSDLLTNGLNKKQRNRSIGDIIPNGIALVKNICNTYGIPSGQYNHLKSLTRDRFEKFLASHPQISSEFTNLCSRDIFYDRIIDIKLDEQVTYDIEVPNTHYYSANGFISHNTKIRGERAGTIIADEFDAIPIDVYEIVISGFGITSSSPIENMIEANRRKILRDTIGYDMEEDSLDRNQSIVSGTAGYEFGHFAKYWQRYKRIIESLGDSNVLKELLGADIPKHFNWKDFSIIRLPIELIPDGFMDQATAARARLTMNSTNYLREYSAVFPRDSEGFFRRTLIESCVVHPEMNPSKFPDEVEVFNASVTGDLRYKYVYGIDPASEIDNFSLVILELHPTHRRVVYCWTTNKHEHKAQLKRKQADKNNFYAYCVKKIRQLMKLFPPERIGCDSQGGGIGIREAFCDEAHIPDGEVPIYEIIDPDIKKHKDTDDKAGLHIAEFVNFASADWVGEANHGLKQDMENKLLLFPYFDPASLEMAVYEDEQIEKEGKLRFDSLEDCIFEIEQLKDELTTIVRTQTMNQNRDRWDTPEVKLAGNKKGRMKKDRYSALLIANMLARQIYKTSAPIVYDAVAGFAHQMRGKLEQGASFYSHAPDWWAQACDEFYR